MPHGQSKRRQRAILTLTERLAKWGATPNSTQLLEMQRPTRIAPSGALDLMGFSIEGLGSWLDLAGFLSLLQSIVFMASQFVGNLPQIVALKLELKITILF